MKEAGGKPITTKELINLLRAVKEIPLPGEQSVGMIDEIINRLEEYDELKEENESLVNAMEEGSR